MTLVRFLQPPRRYHSRSYVRTAHALCFAGHLFREVAQPIQCRPEALRLYSDSKLMEPLWFEHPHHGNTVDVVAVPLPENLCEPFKLFPINNSDFDEAFKEEVADDAFAGAPRGSDIFGRIRNFVGVYSRRIGGDELKAQLGIVWKARVIDDIVDARRLGKPPHLT